MNSTAVKRAMARANNYRNDSDDGLVWPLGVQFTLMAVLLGWVRID